MNGPWGHYAKWHESDKKDKYHMIYLICTTEKQQQAHRYREEIGGCQMGGWGVGEMSEGNQKEKRRTKTKTILPNID